MPRIAVGLFKHPSLAELAIDDLAAGGFARGDLRIVAEPRVMEDVTVGSRENAGAQTGVAAVSTARSEFEAQLSRELIGFGATRAEVGAYIQGVRSGGVLVFATGNDRRVDSAVDILNRRGAVDTEAFETDRTAPAAAPHPPAVATESMTPIRDESVQVGRGRSSGGGARVFVW